MKPILFKSECSPAMNAKILRVIEKLVCYYRNELTSGWRCCIEFQRSNAAEPYYQLDLQSNIGGGELAPFKMQTLKLFPDQCATGNIDLSMIIRGLLECGKKIPEEFYERLLKLPDALHLTFQDWTVLQDFGITRWRGGIRIPYEILVTEIPEGMCQQSITETSGEIRIAFSGAKEWQDLYFAFSLFERIQNILNSEWNQDQIWWNLRAFDSDPNLSFWNKALDLREAPED